MAIRYFIAATATEAFRRDFDTICSTLADGLIGVRGGVKTPLRAVRYSDRPSRHACDDRCVNAKGRTFNCECACGGANHGKGSFVCEAA